MTDMSVNIAGIRFRNPVMTASGTFGSGLEYSEFVDLCNNRGISAPSWDTYTNIVEFVYAGMITIVESLGNVLENII